MFSSRRQIKLNAIYSCSVPVAESSAEVATPTWWCIACRENGVMEIYTLPDFKLVFLVKNFNMAPRVLVDSGSASAARYQSPLFNSLQFYFGGLKTEVWLGKTLRGITVLCPGARYLFL